MPSSNQRKITRRKFVVYFTFTALGFAIAYSNSNTKKNNNNKETIVIQSSLKEEISSFNKKRRVQLEKNLRNEIIKDHKDEKTIWIGTKFYTYAELSRFNTEL